MGLYIEDAKKQTIRHYNTTPQLEKSIETMLQDIKNIVWSETGEGYVVEYKDIDEPHWSWEHIKDKFGQHKIKCPCCTYIEPEFATFSRNFCPNCGAEMVESEEENGNDD